MNRTPNLPREFALLWTLATGWYSGPAAAAADQQAEAGGELWLAASDIALDDMRGGFDFGAGLVASLGIERAVYINGNLITTTSFNFENLGRLSHEQMAILSKQAPLVNLIQNGPGNVYQPGPSTPAATASAAAAQNKSAASASGTQGAPDTPNTVAQNTPIVGSSPLPGATATPTAIVQTTLANNPGTYIQNTLSNQHIQTLTVINATVNSLGMMKNMHSLATLQHAINSAVRI